MKALVTGSGGLIGSGCTHLLCSEGWEVIGLDNDQRSRWFGNQGTTGPTVQNLLDTHAQYRHLAADIRDRDEIREIFRRERPDFIVHTAAQPSHDLAASVPYEDFDVNA